MTYKPAVLLLLSGCCGNGDDVVAAASVGFIVDICINQFAVLIEKYGVQLLFEAVRQSNNKQ